MTPFCLVYFRYRREGKEHGKLKGGLIVASNHRSFFDPFLIGGILPWRRPMNYVAKVELFRNPIQAWWISRLGAFPIRRGESDEDSVRPRGWSSNAAAPSASSPRAPGSAAARSPTPSAASAASRSRPAPRSCRPR